MTKRTSHGITTYHANVKSYTMPRICEEFVGDDGNVHYILDNGRTTLQTSYNALWLPIKTKVNWGAKGKNPDRTRIER